MKNILIFLILILVFSCAKHEDLSCVKRLIYKLNVAVTPPTLIIDFQDEKGVIENNLKTQNCINIIFFSIDSNERNQGYFNGNYQKIDGLIRVSVGINYFCSFEKRSWSTKKVEEFLKKNDIGLVLRNKDTIILKHCPSASAHSSDMSKVK